MLNSFVWKGSYDRKPTVKAGIWVHGELFYAGNVLFCLSSDDCSEMD